MRTDSFAEKLVEHIERSIWVVRKGPRKFWHSTPPGGMQPKDDSSS